MTIRLVPVERGRRFECFDCGIELISPARLRRCPNCGAEDEFHLMN